MEMAVGLIILCFLLMFGSSLLVMWLGSWYWRCCSWFLVYLLLSWYSVQCTTSLTQPISVKKSFSFLLFFNPCHTYISLLSPSPIFTFFSKYWLHNSISWCTMQVIHHNRTGSGEYGRSISSAFGCRECK